MVKVFTLSGLAGLVCSVAAWAATIAIVGSDHVVSIGAREIDWPTVISTLTAALIAGVVISLHRIVEPILTALAAIAGCALLYNTREFPFVSDSSSLSRTSDNYWPVVAGMIAIFMVLLIGLRSSRTSGST